MADLHKVEIGVNGKLLLDRIIYIKAVLEKCQPGLSCYLSVKVCHRCFIDFLDVYGCQYGDIAKTPESYIAGMRIDKVYDATECCLQ